jgi:hypothetical protein
VDDGEGTVPAIRSTMGEAVPARRGRRATRTIRRVPGPRRLLWGLLLAVWVGVAAWVALSWFRPTVKVSDISRTRGR